MQSLAWAIVLAAAVFVARDKLGPPGGGLHARIGAHAAPAIGARTLRVQHA